MIKNDILRLSIIDVTADGSGVGKFDNMVVFVPRTAVGDVIDARILKVKKGYAYGKVETLITPSVNRIIPDCDAFGKCGGCVYRHISYDCEKQLKYKKVYETVKRIGGVDMLPEEIIAGDSDERYRNKAQYPLDGGGKVGFFSLHSHRVVPCSDCKLQPKIFGRISNAFEEWISKSNISVYDEVLHRGLLRHLYIRIAEATKEIMVTVVINGESLPYTDTLIKMLKAVCGEDLRSVCLNINKEKTNVILGEKCVCLYGDEYITDILCGVKVRISPLSFYQVNRSMAEKLYLKAAEYACPENKNVLDLYCGAGTIGLSMAKKAKSVIGVEIVPEAIKDARFNAQNNNITNARFICGDATKAAEELAKEKTETDAVILDPPRKGLTEELIGTVCNEFSPERVVYVSCDVGTLARDIRIFSDMGYSLKKYTPVDLFPRTAHVETVALLVRTDSLI